MSDARTEIEKEVQGWLDYAAEDLRYAKIGLTQVGEEPARLIAYHAQQSAEKNLKAYLLDCCGRYALWVDELRDAEELTPYAVTARYPGIASSLKLEDARRAIAIADKVEAVVRDGLKQEGFGLVPLQP